MLPLIRASGLLALVTLISVGCDSGEAELAPGEFEATATGAADSRLRGNAYFAVSDGYLTLTLPTGSSGTVPPAPGLHLSVPWDGEPGTLSLGSDANLTRSFVVLAAGLPRIFEVEDGSVTVTAASADQVEGTFDVNAADVSQPPGSEALRVEGAFVAVTAP